jgi:hypothetical protein
MIDVASALRSEVERAAVGFTRLTESEAVRDRGQGRWVTKEILGHLIDSAVNNHQRFVRARFVDPLIWPGYDQVAWVAAHRYRERPWAELVGLWAALNRHLAGAIGSTPPERLRIQCIIGEKEPATLEWWMRDYLRHLRHHLGQVIDE